MLEKLKELGLSEEQVEKVNELYKNAIPYSRFQEMVQEKNSLKESLVERDKQLSELLKTNKDNEELTKKLQDLQEMNKKQAQEHIEALGKLKIENAIESALLKANSLNTRATKALLDFNKITIKDDEVIGIEEQITSLKKDESTSFLFKTETKENLAPVGFNPEVATSITKNENRIKSYAEIVEEMNN